MKLLLPGLNGRMIAIREWEASEAARGESGSCIGAGLKDVYPRRAGLLNHFIGIYGRSNKSPELIAGA